MSYGKTVASKEQCHLSRRDEGTPRSRRGLDLGMEEREGAQGGTGTGVYGKQKYIYNNTNTGPGKYRPSGKNIKMTHNRYGIEN